MKLGLIFSLFLVIVTNSQSCADLVNPDDRILSGSLQITSAYSAKKAKGLLHQRESTYTVLFKGSLPAYQIVASFADYSFTGANNNQDFSIIALPLSESSAKLIVLINDDGRWSHLKVSYLASGRSDFFMGAFIGDGYFKKKNSKGELVLQYAVPLWKARTSQVTAVALLSGVRIATTGIPQLRLSTTKMNSTIGLLEVNVAYSSPHPFEYIKISYICFLQAASLKFIRFDPALPNSFTYPMVFLDSYANKKMGFKGVAFNGTALVGCRGNSCPTACISINRCKIQKGIAMNNSCLICVNRSTWNGSACVCSSGLFNISNSCLPCDPNSVYSAAAQTCQCRDGFFGTYQLCSACDPSCLTCQQAGPSGCLTCRGNATFFVGSCLPPCAVGTFRQGPLCQACASFCQTCSSSTACSQCQTGYSLNPSGICLPSAPTSKLHLAGAIDSNRLIFQGIAINQLPSTVQANNCQICPNLFIVNTSITGVTASKPADYVVDSQYWFVITFDYGTSVVRPFDFTVQIDPTYKDLFTFADMRQIVSGSIDPSIYASFSDVGPVKPNVGVNQISRSTGKFGNTTVQLSTRGRLSADSATVKAIFGP